MEIKSEQFDFLPPKVIHFVPATDACDLTFGGKNEVVNAVCPNCRRSLFLLLTLDAHAPGLSFVFPQRFVPLLYCLRCELGSAWFVYKVRDNSCEVVRAHRGTTDIEGWRRRELGDEYPTFGVRVSDMPCRLRRLHERARRELEPIEDVHFWRKWRSLVRPAFKCDWLGMNQLGGKSLSIQNVDPPDCTCGKSEVAFLASIVGDPDFPVRIYDNKYLQVMFWACRSCGSVFVWNSI